MAEASGADVIELDVWLHRGRLEVRHEKTMWVVPLLWDRWKIAPGWTPRLHLDESLREIGDGPAALMLDLKGNDLRLPAAALAAVTASGTRRRIVVCSQNWRMLDAITARNGVGVWYSIGKRWRLRAVLEGRDRPRGDGISIHQKFLDTPTISALRAVAPTIVTWPVNDEARLRALVELGVAGMITDEASIIETVVRARVT